MAATLSSATEDRLFNIVCSKAGIQPGELSIEFRHALLNDQQNSILWDQLRSKIQSSGSDRSSHARLGGQQFAEFERVVGVESIYSQLSLTPERIRQTEEELEALNRKTQSLVDTLKSHNARLGAMTDGSAGTVSTDAAQAALEAKVRELKERKRELDEECEQLAIHADQRLDRYITSEEHDGQRSQAQSEAASSSGIVKYLRDIFDGLLQPHDRILEKLDVLCTELQFDDTEQKGVFDDARRLSNEIIFAIVAHQRMVLDIVFIQACKSYQDGGRKRSTSTIEDEREAIVGDLRSLWDEVVPVAHMAVENQLIGPIMKAKAGTSDVRDQRYALIATYTSSMLRYMNERLEEFATRIKTLIAHHKALVETFKVFQARTQKHDAERNASTISSSHDAVATARTSRSSKAGRIPTNATPLDNLLTALEALGVSTPPPPQNDDSSSYNTSELAAHLDRHIQSRSAKSHLLVTDMQSLFEATAKSTMGDSFDATRLLAESLVAECNGGISSSISPPSDTRSHNSSAHRSSISKMTLEVGGGFFADAELEKIIADEARSVASIADGFNKLLKNVDGDAGLTPGQFVKDAHKRAVAAQAAIGASTGSSAKASTQLKDPKVHEIVEKWGR